MRDRALVERGIAVVLALLAGCGGGSGSTGRPTAPPASVTGLVVVGDDVARRDAAAVGTPPAEWRAGAGTTSGGAALSHAEWTVAGTGHRGATAADGTFEIVGIEAGRHVLELSRTLGGDWIRAALPFSVGDDGGAAVLVEIGWGSTRATSSLTRDGRAVAEIFASSSVHVVLEDGIVVELGDGIRVWRDRDRDGRFDECTVTTEVGTCTIVAIEEIATSVPSSLRAGQSAYAGALLVLDDGSSLDVTSLVEWRSSDPGVAIVDPFGRVDATTPGRTEIQARLGRLGSVLSGLEVVERGALRRIEVQNASCYYPYGLDGRVEPSIDPVLPPPRADGGIWAPVCSQVIEVGGTLDFAAIGEFADGDVQEITDEVEWTVEPGVLGDVANGRFTGRSAGTGVLLARLGAVQSEPSEIRVVTEPTLVALHVYPADGGEGAPRPATVGTGPAGDAPLPCPGCGGFALTTLRGDRIPLHANGEYDTGTWRDLTDVVAWSSSAPDVAPVDAGGTLLALAAGESTVLARLGDVTSGPGQVRVVDQAAVESLWIHSAGDRVVALGDQRFFAATASFDVGFSRDVTDRAAWHSSAPGIARFDAAGVLTAAGAGDVEVWAEIDGVRSESVRLEVFSTGELDYCDPANVNRGTWTDGFNRVVLESDCARYAHPGVAALRFTVTESASPGGIFDPCLDLYVYRGATRIRTIREEGCGDPFLPNGAPGIDEEILKYQLRAFWDLKDDAGEPVPAGTYEVHGRFYLYYDPVVSLAVTIE